MHTTTLSKIGGSVMMAIPPAILDLLALEPSATVGLTVENGRLTVAPVRRPRYRLADLLAEHQAEPPTPMDEDWVNDGPVGREAL